MKYRISDFSSLGTAAPEAAASGKRNKTQPKKCVLIELRNIGGHNEEPASSSRHSFALALRHAKYL